MTADLLGLINHLLPGPGGIGTEAGTVTQGCPLRP
jgi:hypothetical protein